MDEINREIDLGHTDKKKIYDNVVLTTGVPRPVVRRCSAMLIKKMKGKIMVLADDPRITEELKKKLLTIY